MLIIMAKKIAEKYGIKISEVCDTMILGWDEWENKADPNTLGGIIQRATIDALIAFSNQAALKGL